MWVGVLASWLFVAYPFTIFTVGNFASLMHPAVVCLTLTGMLAVCRFERAPRRGWLAVMLVATILVPYFHESGVMVSAILVWAMICLDVSILRRYPRLPVVLFHAQRRIPGGLVARCRRRVTCSPGQGPKMIFESATFFLQGLTFPVQPWAMCLIERLKWNDVATIWLVGLLSLVGLAAILGGRPAGKRWCRCDGFGWAGLSDHPQHFRAAILVHRDGPALAESLCQRPP